MLSTLNYGDAETFVRLVRDHMLSPLQDIPGLAHTTFDDAGGNPDNGHLHKRYNLLSGSPRRATLTLQDLLGVRCREYQAKK